MAEESRLAISSAEREVLRVLWDLGAVGVKEVSEQLAAEGSEWTRSTIITLLQRLEKKGYVSSDKSGFAFVFQAAVSRDDLVRQRLAEVADELCEGEWTPLLLAFAQQKKLTEKDVGELQKLIDALASKVNRPRKGRG